MKKKTKVVKGPDLKVKVKQLNQAIEDQDWLKADEQATKLLKDVRTMGTYNFKSLNPPLGKKEVLILIEKVKKYAEHGVPMDLEELNHDITFMDQFVQVLEDGTGFVHSLDLHIAH